MKTSIRSQLVRGFSLVEVVIALGIVVFVLVTILGMLPIGLRQAGDSEHETRAVNIMGAIAADRMSSGYSSSSPIYHLPPLVAGSVYTNFFYVKESGAYAGADPSDARYRVSYVIYPPGQGRLDPWRLFVRMSWPAADTNAPGTVESLVAIPQ